MPSKGTPPTNIRLTDDDLAIVQALRVRYGLKSGAAAIRKALETARLVMEAEGNAVARVARKQMGKKSGEGG